MKKILLITTLFIMAIAAQAQTPTFRYHVPLNMWYTGMKIDSLVILKGTDTANYPASTSKGAFMFQASDSQYYYSNGTKWGAMGGDISTFLAAHAVTILYPFYSTDSTMGLRTDSMPGLNMYGTSWVQGYLAGGGTPGAYAWSIGAIGNAEFPSLQVSNTVSLNAYENIKVVATSPSGEPIAADSTKDYASHQALLDTAKAIRADFPAATGSNSVTYRIITDSLVTLTATDNVVILNPTTDIYADHITFPATPVAGQHIIISWVAAANPVLQFIMPSGETTWQQGSAGAGGTFVGRSFGYSEWVWDATSSTWYVIDLHQQTQ